MTLHVRVECGGRDASSVFSRITFQLLKNLLVFRDKDGRVVLNRYFILEMDFSYGKSRFVFYLVKKMTNFTLPFVLKLLYKYEKHYKLNRFLLNNYSLRPSLCPYNPYYSLTLLNHFLL